MINVLCVRCGKQNPPEKNYCDVCHGPLSEKAMIEVEEKKTSELKELVEAMIKAGLQAELKKMADVIIQKRLEDMQKKS